jgi:hypothetical protein
MKNRERYITQRNEYDLMMDITDNTNVCPIIALTGKYPDDGYGCRHSDDKCPDCLQAWLNEEEKEGQP